MRNAFHGWHSRSMETSNTPTREAVLRDLTESALRRQHYLLWLAGQLEQTHDLLIRTEAAAALRQLAGAEE
jgi:hypothetical protein